MIHGEPFPTVDAKGPELPAEQETKTPFFVAPNEAIAILSLKNGFGILPKESESTSTPSETAWSIAANTSEFAQPESQHTLYAAILEVYLIPLAEPLASPKMLAF
jgi:hypothetical protein